MIRLLEPPLELVQEPDWEPGAAAILVDCGPEASHHLLNGRDVQPVAVIDHHLGGRRLNLPFADLRPKTAASATIAASYLKEQALIPGERLATALVYGIRTETSGSETHYSRLDRSMLAWLSRYANPSWLAEIENAPLSREYYNDLVLALQNTFLYDDAALCVLPRAEGPETVGEVADLLIRGEGIHRVLCAAAYNGDILVSVRTEEESDSAAELVRRTLKGLGHGGGHAHRAGGKIPGAAAEKISEAIRRTSRSLARGFPGRPAARNSTGRPP
ncbi:MAG: hypothetical protein GXP27_20155 [Planctomycetes bacterium]|nr:hypothetical protein [Planctomycetota bacterium]